MFKWLFKRKVKQDKGQPHFSGAFVLLEDALKKIENASYVLEDTKDFEYLPILKREQILKTMKDQYKKGHFHISSLRDEVAIGMREIPQCEKKRRKQHARNKTDSEKQSTNREGVSLKEAQSH